MKKFIGPFIVGAGTVMIVYSLFLSIVIIPSADRVYKENELLEQQLTEERNINKEISSQLEDMNKKIEELSSQLPK